MKGSDKNKLIIVLVLFALAATVLIWQYRNTLFPAGASTPATGNAGEAGTAGEAGAADGEDQPGNRRLAPK